MVHGNMTKEEIGNSSLPFIFAIMSTMGRRLCEKLGVPYKSKKEQQQNEDEVDYPVPEASRARRNNTKKNPASDNRKVSHDGEPIKFTDLETKYLLTKGEIVNLLIYLFEMSGF